MDSFDLVVVGSGPGGYVAAIRAAHLGLSTALVEKDDALGGTCLLRGCIPTKSLLRSAELLRQMRRAKSHGIVASSVDFDFAAVGRARDRAVKKNSLGVTYLLKQNQVHTFQGHARFVDPHQLIVEGPDGKRALTSRHVVLATGATPKTVPQIPVDRTHVLFSNDLLTIDTPPASLLVLGAGAIGVEFASLFAAFGTVCTLVELLPGVLPSADHEVQQELAQQLRRERIHVHTQTRLERFETKDHGVTAHLTGPDGALSIEAEKMLVAIGRQPYTKGLGLDAAGLACDAQGFVPVSPLMQTARPHIYAIGDLVATPQLAHVASHEALVAVDHLAGQQPGPIDYEQVPLTTFCEPEVASCGLTETAARERFDDVTVGRFPFSALGKARVLGIQHGWVKVVARGARGPLLGIHIIGPHATDLIGEGVVALRAGLTAADLAHTIHAHPTLPEALMEAAHGAAGRCLHL